MASSRFWRRFFTFFGVSKNPLDCPIYWTMHILDSCSMSSFTETRKILYGAEHRIIIKHSSRMEKMQIISFKERLGKLHRKVRKIAVSGDSDSMEKAGYYLRRRNSTGPLWSPQ